MLVLATLWPEYWDQLTARPPGDADPHAQARELLSGHDIQVPAAFTPGQLRELEEAGDPRLAQAADGTRDRQVIQYLAGAPALLDRYHHAPPAAQALIHAAMDAARLGMSPALSRAFLEAAAPGYLTDTDWDLLPGDWLEQALDYTAKPCKGVRGPLAPIRPRPVSGALPSPGDGPAWQLADYLDQQGRRARREEIPPASFWTAAASCAGPAGPDRSRPGRRGPRPAPRRGPPVQAGQRRWPSRCGCQPRPVAAHPAPRRPAPGRLGRRPRQPRQARSASPSCWARCARAGATGQVTTLASRAAAHTSLDNLVGVTILLGALREAGASGQVSTLLDRDPAAHASLDYPYFVTSLLDALREAGAPAQAAKLIERLPAAGMFQLFLNEEVRGEQFWFGREADGRPAGRLGLDRPRLNDLEA